MRRKRRVKKTARRRSYTRTIYKKARRGYRKRKGFLTGNMGNIIIGAGYGAIEPMIPQFLGGWTSPLVAGAVGWYFKKPALMGIAGYQVGQLISPFGNGSQMGGFKGQGE